MEILTISPTGQSVEYRCAHCSKKFIGMLLPGKDGSEAVLQFKVIKKKFESYKILLTKEFLKSDIDISFIVVPKFSDSLESRQRTSIHESTRHEVWRRDQGKCVICGSQINLEFDHIIPFSKEVQILQGISNYYVKLVIEANMQESKFLINIEILTFIKTFLLFYTSKSLISYSQ